MSMNQPASRSTWEIRAVFLFGAVFLVLIALIAFMIPTPSDFQEMVFRIILALSAAGVGSLFPGFLDFRYQNFLRAGGAMAMFVLVYLVNPATYVIGKSSTDISFPTSPFRITIVTDEQGNLVANRYDFPMSDIRKRKTNSDFVGLLKELPNISIEALSNSTIFRISDEKTITSQGGDALADDNTGVIVIPNSMIGKYGSKHAAFTVIYSQTRDLK